MMTIGRRALTYASSGDYATHFALIIKRVICSLDIQASSTGLSATGTGERVVGRLTIKHLPFRCPIFIKNHFRLSNISKSGKKLCQITCSGLSKEGKAL